MIGQAASLPPDKMKEIAAYLNEKFRSGVTARSQQVDDKMRRWDSNYDAVPFQAIRTTPFYRASNFVPQLIRMHCDISVARILGILFGTKPFWKPTSDPFSGVKREMREALEGWINFKCHAEIDFFNAIDQTVTQMVRNGTHTMKVSWAEDSITVGGQDGKTDVNKRCALDPIPFDDFWPWPITADDLTKVLIKFERIRLTEEQVKGKQRRGEWNREATELLLKGAPAQVEPSRDENARSAGIQLIADVDFPFIAVEAWFTYSLGAKDYHLVAVFNPLIASEKSILSLSFAQSADHPFVDFRAFPRKGLYFGYAQPEILEQSQEEQAQIHNARRDANMIANVPTFKKKRYADVPHSASEWYPGKTFELDDIDDMDVLNLNASYNSMIDEETYVVSLAERYTGISPPMQGFGAGQMQGKRGIYTTGGTLALLSEGNRRMDIYIRRVRSAFHRVGRLIFQNYKTFGKEDFSQYGDNGRWLSEAFKAELPRGFVWDIGASDSGANQEIDRTNLLMVANTLGQYYQRLWEGVSVVGQIPADNPAREIFIQVLEGAGELANRVLFAFNQGERDRLVPDVRRLLSGQGATQPGPPGGGGPQEPVSGDQLSDLSERIAAFSGGNNGSAGGGGRPA